MAEGNDNVQAAAGEREIISTRVFDAPRGRVFKAWTDPVHLALWWGPKGFKNTFHEFDLRPGGSWQFTMHSPDGVDYKNKSVFVEIKRPARLVFDHATGPRFRATAVFEEQGRKTKITYRMAFATDKEFAYAKAFAPKANEENFDRLKAELAKMA